MRCRLRERLHVEDPVATFTADDGHVGGDGVVGSGRRTRERAALTGAGHLNDPFRGRRDVVPPRALLQAETSVVPAGSGAESNEDVLCARTTQAAAAAAGQTWYSTP